MLDRIKASLPSLAPAEQRVGKLVLQDPRAFANLPVTELADRAHVSKPTVVRFCRSVGYDGLSDFKLKLAGSVSEGVPFIHRSVDADDKTSDVAVKVIDNTVAAFLKYRNDASSFALDQAVQALAETHATGRRIEFYGVGNSGIVAQDAQHKFFPLGHEHHCLQRRPHAGDECFHAGQRRLCGGYFQFGAHPRPHGRLRHCPQTRCHHHRHHLERIAFGSSRSNSFNRRSPRKLRSLQPHGVAAFAFADH
jgi:hypothetical protein